MNIQKYKERRWEYLIAGETASEVHRKTHKCWWILLRTKRFLNECGDVIKAK